MNYSTKPSFLENMIERCWPELINNFHGWEEDEIDSDDSSIISPVEAELVHIGRIEADGQLISKFGRKMILHRLKSAVS